MLNKLKKTMKIPFEDNRGITYVELIVGVALLTGVLMIGYAFLSFSYKSLIFNQAKYDATQEARNAMMVMGSNIRKSHSVTVSGIRYNAVEVSDNGFQIDIHVDVDEDGAEELVRYKLQGNELLMGQAELGHNPGTWYTVLSSVSNDRTSQPIFKVDDSTINIDLYIKDNHENMSSPINVNVSYTVRSKGGM